MLTDGVCLNVSQTIGLKVSQPGRVLPLVVYLLECEQGDLGVDHDLCSKNRWPKILRGLSNGVSTAPGESGQSPTSRLLALVICVYHDRSFLRTFCLNILQSSFVTLAPDQDLLLEPHLIFC